MVDLLNIFWIKFEYLLDKINETPDLANKNIEIINCSCHQSQKFLFEEIKNYLNEMSKYFSIPNHVKPHITLPKNIDEKIKKLEENENTKELFDTLRTGETFKQELLNSMVNAKTIKTTIQNAKNLRDLYDKIFPAKNVMVQVASGPNINIVKNLNSNSSKQSVQILMPISGNLLGANDQQPLSEDERIRQNTAKRILLQLDGDRMAKMLQEFHTLFENALTNK